MWHERGALLHYSTALGRYAPLSGIESGLREVAAEQVPPSLLAADENAGSLNATVGMTSTKLIMLCPAAATLARSTALRLEPASVERHRVWLTRSCSGAGSSALGEKRIGVRGGAPRLGMASGFAESEFFRNL